MMSVAAVAATIILHVLLNSAGMKEVVGDFG